jgi:hypothetical protein
MIGFARYGEFRWGESSDRGDQQARGPRYKRRDRGPTPAELFGSGLKLNAEDDPNYTFDLAVEDGSFVVSGGYVELHKDIAYRLTAALRDVVGGLGDPEEIADIRLAVQQALPDNRIQRVDSVRVRKPARPDRQGLLVIESDVTTTNGEQESLVTPVSTPAAAPAEAAD